MIKFLVKIDTKIDYRPEVEDALRKQQDTYRTNGVNIEYEIGLQDLSSAPWLSLANVVSYSWLNTDTAKLKSAGESAYSVVYIFHPDNWKAEGIGGWHMGKYNGYQVQLIKGFKDNPLWLYRTLMMEGLHSWDTPIREKLGIDLSRWLDVADYDETLVHGMYEQGTILSQEDSIRIFGQEYIKYDYSLLIKKISPLINRIFPMYKHVIYNGEEQYLRGQDGKDYHIFNLATLNTLKAIGIVSSAEPEFVDSIDNSGITIFSLQEE